MIEEEYLNAIMAGAPAFLLIAARALAMIETAPLLSSDAVPQVAKIALAGFVAFCGLPTAIAAGWNLAPLGLQFVYLLIGEALVGIILGFYLTLIFSAFSTAGQFFSLQMGFGASETYDPLSQVENPLMGQYLNLVAMLVFLSVEGFQRLFLGGFLRSIRSVSAWSLAAGRDTVAAMLLAGLSRVFLDAMVISMPILGTLFLCSLATGLISKAAPQINILTEGFPVSITAAFILILATMPFMAEAFSRVVDAGFRNIESLYIALGRQLEGGS
jgi:flagellar biosynthetic protein FliR